MGQVKDQAMTQAKRCKFMLKPFFIMATVYFVGILAILRANFNYIDDMGRVFAGYQSWGNFSRYLSSALSNLVHADSYLTDVSPLTQLLAICILAAAGVVLLYIVTEKRTFIFWSVFPINTTLPTWRCPFLPPLSPSYFARKSTGLTVLPPAWAFLWCAPHIRPLWVYSPCWSSYCPSVIGLRGPT